MAGSADNRQTSSYDFAAQLGISVCREFDPQALAPEARIRAFCEENKCGSYGNNYMCPPHAGSLAEIKGKLKRFHRGVLLQYVKFADVRSDRAAVMQAHSDFQTKLLQVEEFIKQQVAGEVWGLGGGACRLCEVCGAKTGEPCPHPDKARVSMEAAGIDVQQLLNNLGLDSQFHTDRVIWTGCILIGKTTESPHG